LLPVPACYLFSLLDKGDEYAASHDADDACCMTGMQLFARQQPSQDAVTSIWKSGVALALRLPACVIHVLKRGYKIPPSWMATCAIATLSFRMRKVILD